MGILLVLFVDFRSRANSEKKSENWQIGDIK